MILARILPTILFLALAFAPFGRMAAAQATAMPAHHGAAAMHMDGQHGGGDEKQTAIDCMMACAMVAPALASAAEPGAFHPIIPAAAAAQPFAGHAPEADPPPPRFS